MSKALVWLSGRRRNYKLVAFLFYDGPALPECGPEMWVVLQSVMHRWWRNVVRFHRIGHAAVNAQLPECGLARLSVLPRVFHFSDHLRFEASVYIRTTNSEAYESPACGFPTGSREWCPKKYSKN